MFCAGDKRLSVPQARFLLHSVRGNFKNEALEENVKKLPKMKDDGRF